MAWTDISEFLSEVDERRTEGLFRPAPYVEVILPEHFDCGYAGCDVWRASASAILEHRAKTHAKRPRPRPDEAVNAFPCRGCDRTFHSPTQREWHEDAKHPGLPHDAGEGRRKGAST